MGLSWEDFACIDEETEESEEEADNEVGFFALNDRFVSSYLALSRSYLDWTEPGEKDKVLRLVWRRESRGRA